MVQLSRRGPALALIAAVLLLFGGAGRVVSNPVSAGVVGTTTDVEVRAMAFIEGDVTVVVNPRRVHVIPEPQV